MNCSTSLTPLPILPRLPRGLVFLLILGFVWRIGLPPPLLSPSFLPALTLSSSRCHVRHSRSRSRRHVALRYRWRNTLGQTGLRLLVRSTLLVGLLHTSGWFARAPWAGTILLIPLLQTWLTLNCCAQPTQAPSALAPWVQRLQRLHQLVWALLLVSTLIQFLGHLPRSSAGMFLSVALGVCATSPDDEAQIHIDTPTENHYHITLHGAFHLVWEPRDSFEKWMLIFFLRHLHRVGETRPFLRQYQITQAFGVLGPVISAKTKEVERYGWNILSERYRHRVHSALPDAEMSRAILQIWVPAFWLSAWDVRERLIQAQVIPNREALTVEAIHAIAKHTGFNQVRDQLLERFDAPEGRLIAKDTWWLRELLALNERLIAKLERGERLTPQERVDLESMRLKSAEKPGDSEETSPLAAALKSVLFEPPSDIPTPSSAARPAPIRCTYCGSDQVAPKSIQPRRKTVIDEFGEKHVLEVLRYYCKNSNCVYQTFTHFPQGVLPHSHYSLQVRLLAVEVYETLLSTYRRSARMFGVKAATVYHWVASLSPAATCLAAYLGVVRTSGVVGIDDKWIQVCSPSAVRPHGRRSRAVWRYVYFAIDVYSYDLLALELYPEHSTESARLLLLELKAKGIRPRVVVTDLDPAYGHALPEVFPSAVHHECIFHALQNASAQMTQVYGRYYTCTALRLVQCRCLENASRPETVPLHEAITQLFHAQTQKTVRLRFAELLAMREIYVTKTPEIACVFDSLERHFPKLVNAIESPDIPRTNNATELVIRRFDQHYQVMGGLDTLESAKNYLRVFELVYRLTPFSDDGRPEIRGQSPLELAGYDLKQLPIANFFFNLKLPPLTLPVPEVVPMA